MLKANDERHKFLIIFVSKPTNETMAHKYTIRTLIALVGLCLGACRPSSGTPIDSLVTAVNPFIGTDFTGNTYPGAQAPFGMVQLSPDNGLPGWDRIAGYFYPDSTIAGVSHTHLSGTGAGDLYDISFLPVSLPYREEAPPLGVHSRFSHHTEQAEAGYYRVTLDDYDIDVELTATERCGIQRYTFGHEASAVLLNLSKAMNWDRTVDWRVEQVDSVTIRGYRFSDGWARNQRLFFCARFSRPFERMEQDSIVCFFFRTRPGDRLVVSTALSAVSQEGAARNLAAEVPTDDFDHYLRATQDRWNEVLSRVRVDGGSAEDRTIFYTALYRTMLAPTLYDDVDGQYRGPDGAIHQTDGWRNYGTFSLWDTFRAAHPLYTYVVPERVNDMVRSLLAFYDQNGRLPVWNFQGSETDMMIGYHAVPVIVDAYLKGFDGFDAEKALQACIATANLDHYRGIGEYKRLGYVPYRPQVEGEEDWSLSKTLEYAYDDYCIARMAERMGRHEVAKEFDKRALHYRNVYNPNTSFMQPRGEDGRFQPNFVPEAYTPYICESNAWHYLWSVQHDVKGLISLLGGQERFAQKLDSMFTFNPSSSDTLPIFSTGMIGQYVHGNEPSHHVIYLHNAIARPHLTQKYVAQVMNELYRNTPDGLCGNEDCGQMSAWYVFSAMGFYPVDPISQRYEIGTPLFPKLELTLPGGKKFTVLAPGVSKEHIYVKSVRLNGKPHTQSYITHTDIVAGGTLEFEMSHQPCNFLHP